MASAKGSSPNETLAKARSSSPKKKADLNSSLDANDFFHRLTASVDASIRPAEVDASFRAAGLFMEERKWNCTAFRCRNVGCDQIFRDRASLMRHSRSGCDVANAARKQKKNSKAFKCTVDGCGQAFASMDDLKAHVNKDHKPPIPSEPTLNTCFTGPCQPGVTCSFYCAESECAICHRMMPDAEIGVHHTELRNLKGNNCKARDFTLHSAGVRCANCSDRPLSGNRLQTLQHTDVVLKECSGRGSCEQMVQTRIVHVVSSGGAGMGMPRPGTAVQES
eukprot:SAG31_NODE_1896_length_6964_cov_3.399854_6_plen_278_part_00